MSKHDDAHDSEPGGLSRRGAIKAGAAIAVGATVWAEPTIKGLAKRPAYAAGSSADPFVFNVNIALGRNQSTTVNGFNLGGASVTMTVSRDNGNTYSFSTPSGTITGTVSVNGGADASLVSGGSGAASVSSGNNGNQTYSVVGTVQCA